LVSTFLPLASKRPTEKKHWSLSARYFAITLPRMTHRSMTLAYFAEPLLESLVANGADQFSS
jgi:hypothetical protein